MAKSLGKILPQLPQQQSAAKDIPKKNHQIKNHQSAIGKA